MRDRIPFVTAAGLIVLAFVARALVPTETVYRIRAGNTFYRPDTFLFWFFIVAGIGVGIVATLRWLVRFATGG